MEKKQCSSAVGQGGFTALELVVVLMVGFSIIALSATRVRELFSASNKARAAESIISLYTVVEGMQMNGQFPVDPNFEATIIDLKQVPPGLTVNGKTLKNEWGSPITINSKADGFTIKYPGVPSDACVDLAQTMIRNGNFASINVGQAAVTSTSAITAIITACKSSTGTVTMEFSTAASGAPTPDNG